MKKKVKIPIIIGLICLIVLYFFTPGVMLGDIRHIRADSRVEVFVLQHTRVRGGIHGGATFDTKSWDEVITLNEAQVEALRSLLRGAWYTRTPGSGPKMVIQRHPDVDLYHTFTIVHYDTGGFPNFISIGLNGRVSRSNHRNSRLRIRYADWEAAILEILAMSE